MQRSIGVAQRRARLGQRHWLARRHQTDDVAGVTRDLVALHATDPATVFLSLWSRIDGIEPADIERALYEQRTVLRMLAMRRTMFVVPLDLVPVVQAAASDAVAAEQRKRLVGFIGDSDVGADAAAWLATVEAQTITALAARGEATATELSREVPVLRQQLRLGTGTKWETVQAASGRVLLQLGAEGRIGRGRPRGSWISSQYRWRPIDAWLPGGISRPDPADARRELVQQWLARFGPGTIADLRWWTGWTARLVQQALGAIAVEEVALDAGTGLVLADDAEPVPEPEPWVALLPALDATVMGWKERGWYLGVHAPALFDRNGNAGPTVWCDGRVVGGWGQRRDGAVVFRLLEDVGHEASAAVEAEAARLGAWLDGVRMIPRFRTPLEREISS
jgi:hypothetical protein